VDFRFSEEEEEFRHQVQAFLNKELPGRNELVAPWKGETDEEWEFARELTKKMGRKGWLAIWWPREYGGLGGSDTQYLIFNEETAYRRAPRVDQMGTGIVGPTILLHGTEEQKTKFLPQTARGELVWCQAFSEPGAGSDAAGIQTRAVEDGDDYVITGQKIFTTIAHRADFCYLTARTDPNAPKHRGISYFLVDLKSPGVSVRPLINMLGGHSFNEVFFDDVRVPKQNLLGEKNQGWKLMMATLNFERGTLASIAGSARRLLDDLVQYAREDKGKLPAEDSLVRQKLAEMAIEAQVARLFVYRVVWMQGRGFIPTYEASMAKLYADELNFRLARLGTEMLGLYGQLWEGSKCIPLGGDVQAAYLNNLGSLFGGGTPEVQRNIIALIGLGLPRGW